VQRRCMPVMSRKWCATEGWNSWVPTDMPENIIVEKYLRDIKIIQIWLDGGQLARLDVVQSYYPYMESGK